jgi:hypothetical protein
LLRGQEKIGAPKPTAGQDVMFWRNSTIQRGKVKSYDARVIRFEVVIAPGQPPAIVTVPMSEIERIDFAPNPQEKALLAKAGDLSHSAALLEAWRQREPLLTLPASNAGAFGIGAANALLSSADTKQKNQALDIFCTVEARDWDEERRSAARRGRLRAMIALGDGEKAVAEARKIAQEAEDPGVAIEANLMLGEVAFAQLKKLQEDNPRWEEDVNVRPERQRLLHEAIDHLLYPALFHGSEEAPAAKGLWRAVQLCEMAGRITQGAELARDITELYATAKEAGLAAQFLKSHAQNHPQTTDHDT